MEIENEYFNWLCSIINGEYYYKLLTQLHKTKFISVISRDKNRAKDGIDMRRSFGYHNDIPNAEEYITGKCSVLEMMVALSIKCEGIMSDPEYGDRTAQWFWEMVSCLGLNSMTDELFDKKYTIDVLYKFLHRDYKSDGTGGLFRPRGCDKDLRDYEIWWQMNWYINSIT